MEDGLRFAIREGGRTVGAGRVTKVSTREAIERGKGEIGVAGPKIRIA